MAQSLNDGRTATPVDWTGATADDVVPVGNVDRLVWVRAVQLLERLIRQSGAGDVLIDLADLAPGAGLLAVNPADGSTARVDPATVGGSGTPGSGTVTSVGVAVPSALLGVSGTPVTGSGVITLSLPTRSANTVFAGPTTGSAATPAFRSLVAADIPALAYDATGTAAGLLSAHTAASDPHPQYTTAAELAAALAVYTPTSGLAAVSFSGDAADLSGTLSDSRLSANVPLLVGGVLPTAYLPALAITSTSVVASQAAMLALPAETGDVAVRTDEGKTYILSGTDPTQLSHWTWLQAPSGGVTSVNGQSGVVVLAAADVGAQPADATLTALAGITVAANKLIYATGADTFTTCDLTAFGRTVIACADAAALIAALGLATVATTGAYSDLSGRPTLGTAAALNVPSSGNAAAGEVVKGSDTRLTDSRTPSGSAGGDLTGTYPNPVLAASGATAGTYTNPTVTVDAKGRITSVSNGTGGGGGTVQPSQIDHRLTTESGVAVSTSDRTSQSTLYLTPYKGTHVSLYDGSAWQDRTTGEVSLALSGLTSGKNYDVFAYYTGSAVALELSAAWASDSARTDALTTQDGVAVKSGALTRRWVGTIRTTSTTTTEDSQAKQFIWNAANQVYRTLYAYNNTSHSYGTAAFREWNGATNVHCVEWVAGEVGVVASSGWIEFNAPGGATSIATLSLNNVAAEGNGAALNQSSGYVRANPGFVQVGRAGFNRLTVTEYATSSCTFNAYKISGGVWA
jgi:hypothetical protein